jgi:hypothetical protein
MNPENQPNQQKPNLERIAEALSIDWEELDNIPLDSAKSWIIQKELEKVEKGKISYPDNPLLEELLKEYNLESMLPDFRYLGNYFSYWYKIFELFNPNQLISRINIFALEILQALHYLQENNQVEIKINSLQKMGGITIQSPDLIGIIQESLFEYFKEHSFLHPSGYNPENISDSGEHIKKAFREIKTRISKKGRKQGNFQVKRISFTVWKYLQNYTEIKAESGAGYSREQARFIFRFLEIHGMIENPDLIARKEDVISYYLKTYNQSRIRNQKK